VVHLEPIEERAVVSLVADLMGAPAGPALFSRSLWQRTGGNPLFLLETLKALFDAGVLRSDDQGWHTAIDDITVDYSEIDVPPRVSEVIARRLERLDGPAQRVLEVVALASAPLALTVIAAITGLSVPATASAIDAAESSGFLASGLFRHDLLREATVARLGSRRKRITHALLARAYAEEARDAADPGVLAEHWWQAGEVPEARRSWLRQVAHLRSRGLHLAALDVLRGAIARVPLSAEQRWLRIGLAETVLEGGWFDQVPDLLAAASPAPDDPAELHARAALVRATWLLNGGRYSEADSALAAERHWFTLTSDENLRLDLVMFDARIAAERHDLARAIDLVEPEVRRLRATRSSTKRAQFVTSLAALYDQLARHDESLVLHREALSIAKNMGSRYLEAESNINLLFCLADMGRHDEAIAVGERALLSSTFDNEPVIRVNLAANYRQAGKLAESIIHYRHLAAGGQPHLRVIALARWAEAAARLGDTHEAARLIDALLDDLDQTDYPVALGAAAAAVHAWGSASQLERWRLHAPSLEQGTLPAYLQAELADAQARRLATDGSPEGRGTGT
jgi:predicted ATPase